jgi:hypothetical protein
MSLRRIISLHCADLRHTRRILLHQAHSPDDRRSWQRSV